MEEESDKTKMFTNMKNTKMNQNQNQNSVYLVCRYIQVQYKSNMKTGK